MFRGARPLRCAVMVAIAVGVTACSDGSSDGNPAGGSLPVVSAPRPATSATTRITTPPGPAATPASAPIDTAPVTAPIDTPADPTVTASSAVPIPDPPQTGVPGAGGDQYCSAVGEIVVTEYIVALVEAFGDRAGARRAEVTAATTTLDAFARATESQPAAAAAVTQFSIRWQPFVARATTALAAYAADPTELDREWARVLAEHDRNDPVVVLDLGPQAVSALDGAAAALDAAHGPLSADTAYLTAVATPSPELDALLAARCPDVAALTVGDAV